MPDRSVTSPGVSPLAALDDRERTKELSRVNRALHTRSEFNRALIRATSEQELLDQACGIVLEHGGYRMCFVAYAEHDEAKTIRPMAWAGVRMHFPGLTWADTDRGHGPASTAIRTGHAVVLKDLTVNPNVAVWRDVLRQHHLATAAALPLRVDSTIVGAMAFAAAEPDAFTPGEMQLLAELADDVGFGIATMRARVAHAQAAAALRESEQRFRALMSASSDALYRMSADWTEMYHLVGRDFIADTIEPSRTWLQKYIHPEDQPLVLATIQEAIRTKSVFELEHRVLREDGSLGWTFSRAVPIPGANGEIVDWFGMARDVTARKLAQEKVRSLHADLERRVTERTTQLLEANSELESFSYSVSHDLRAPIRHILGFVAMLKRSDEAHLSAKGQHCVDVIADASREMAALIDDLLAFSRMGRTEMRAESVDLDSLVRECVTRLETAASGRPIAWKLPPLPRVTGDRAMLRQVFLNLLDNAIKYTRPRDPAEIEVGSTGSEAGRVVLFVRDNGVGFDPAYATKLFGVFQRLHRADEFEGTGIGLATVRRIVARHGGLCWAEGQIDRGAVVYLTLEAEPGPSGAGAPTA